MTVMKGGAAPEQSRAEKQQQQEEGATRIDAAADPAGGWMDGYVERGVSKDWRPAQDGEDEQGRGEAKGPKPGLRQRRS